MFNNTLAQKEEISSEKTFDLNVFLESPKLELKKYAFIPQHVLNAETLKKLPKKMWSIIPILYLASDNNHSRYVRFLGLSDIASLCKISKNTVSKTMNDFFKGPSEDTVYRVLNGKKCTKEERELVKYNQFRKDYLKETGFDRVERTLANGRTAYDYILPYNNVDNGSDFLIRKSFINEKWSKLNYVAHFYYFVNLNSSSIERNCLRGNLRNYQEGNIEKRTYNTVKGNFQPYKELKEYGISKSAIERAVTLLKNENVLIDHPLFVEYGPDICNKKYGSRDEGSCRKPMLIYLGDF